MFDRSHYLQILETSSEEHSVGAGWDVAGIYVQFLKFI